MLTVLDAEPADAVAMAELFREMDDFYGETAAEPVGTKVDQINSVLFANPPLAYALLARDETYLVGFAAYSFLWPAVRTTKSLYLKELYVSKRHRRLRVGKMLVERILKTAVDNNCSRIEWTTDKDNAEAQQFYKQLGFPSLSSKVFYRVEEDALDSDSDSE